MWASPHFLHLSDRGSLKARIALYIYMLWDHNSRVSNTGRL
jgi:hypothetical protein